MKNPFRRHKAINQQLTRLRDIAATMREAADQMAYETSAPVLRRKLAELDPRLLDLLIDQQHYETVFGTDPDITGSRKRAVQASRFALRVGGDTQLRAAAHTWTDWGFGRELDITANDPPADAVWQECWGAARNRCLFGQAVIHELSNTILRDGEVFFSATASRLDGEVTWRTTDSLDVIKVLHPKNDPLVNLWYICNLTDGQQVAIPDAFTYFALRERFEGVKLPQGVMDVNQTPQSQEHGGTFVCIVAAQRNRDKGGRGWPEFYGAIPWSNVYAQMLREYAAVFSAVAMFVDKLKVEGGSQTVTDVITQLQSSLVSGAGNYQDTNPRPAAGSTWLQNEAADRTRLPLGSAAGDAQTGTLTIATQLATALGVKLSDVGRPDAFQNKSVADSAAEGPQRRWQRYQLFWAATWQDIVEVTLRLQTLCTRQQFGDYSSRLSTSLPMDVDTTEIAVAMKAVNDAVVALTLDYPTATRAQQALLTLMLNDLNVSAVAEIVEPPAAREQAAPLPVHLGEVHQAVNVRHICPLCGHGEAYSYAGHGPLLVCVGCEKTYDPEIE